jgi:putative transcriptional regulator
MNLSPDPKAANQQFLFGQFLVATPSIGGGVFEKSVVFVSSHDDAGALGLIINKELKNVDSLEVLEKMGLEPSRKFKNMPIYIGGPVDTGRGFVLHSADYVLSNTIKYPSGICITSEKKVLQDYIDGRGPKKLQLMMGYSGWVKGQVEEELLSGAWINLPANLDLAFDANPDSKWQAVPAAHGIDINKILPLIGEA